MRRWVARPALLLLLGLAAAAPRPAAAAADDAGSDAASEAGGEGGADAGSDLPCLDASTPACPLYVRYVNKLFAFSVDVPTFLARNGADADGRAQSFAY